MRKKLDSIVKNKECEFENCPNNVFAKGLCRKHYMEQRRKENPIICSVDGCDKYVQAKGLCSRHYNQYTHYGKILKRTRYDRNEITIDGDIAYIDIYNKDGKVIKKAIIDAEDIDKVKDIKWKYNGSDLYNTKMALSLGEAILGGRKHTYIILHKNGDLLDHRKANLVVTKSNRKNNTFKHNTSGRKGVYKLYSKGKFTGDYLVYITHGGQALYLGKTKDFDEAVKLREDKEIELGWIKNET